MFAVLINCEELRGATCVFGAFKPEAYGNRVLVTAFILGTQADFGIPAEGGCVLRRS